MQNPISLSIFYSSHKHFRNTRGCRHMFCLLRLYKKLENVAIFTVMKSVISELVTSCTHSRFVDVTQPWQHFISKNNIVLPSIRLTVRKKYPQISFTLEDHIKYWKYAECCIFWSHNRFYYWNVVRRPYFLGSKFSKSFFQQPSLNYIRGES